MSVTDKHTSAMRSLLILG